MAPPLLLLLLLSLVFTAGSVQDGVNSSSSTTAAPYSDINQTSVTKQKHQSTRDRIEFIMGGSEEEYDYEDESTSVAYTSPVARVSCHYDRCEHLAHPCEEIQRRAGGHCLCPGIDGPNVKPDSPPIKEVLLGETQMTINWCSPSSTVRGYRVLYGKSGGLFEEGPQLNATFRSYTIDRLHPGSSYTVCVVAINEAGESRVEEEEDRPVGSVPGPCRTVHTSMQTLYIGIGIGLAAVAGLLIIVGYFVWASKKNKTKREAKVDERGISNYTYKAGSVDQL
ncbi:LRRN4 C-terminal-like protein [Leptodactylus fuscus]|uniref:LRRN4 C-terminal-like protein n=1 Tax=Leptodactylus fuscus TaxID=238119 RepID=UPI003F4E562D